MLLHCVLFSLLSLLLEAVNAQSTTLYGIEPAFEGEFLTEAFQSLSFGVGTNGVITVVDTAATDRIIQHGTYGVTLQESSNGLVFDASGTVYHEHMSCALDTKAGLASCVFSQSVGGSTNIGTFTPTVLPVTVLKLPAGTSSGTATTPLQTSAKPTETAPPASASAGLSSGALAGIIVAIVIVVLLIIGLVFWLVILRRRRHQALYQDKEGAGGFDMVNTDVERPNYGHRITPFTTSSNAATTPGLSGTSFTVPSSAPLTSVPDDTPISEKRRMFLANSNDNTSDQPTSPASPVQTSTMDTRSRLAPSEYSTNTATSTEADNTTRHILDEMRRMRAEVAELRTQAVPPEYTEE